MRRIIIRTLLAALLVLGGQQAWGFAFLGPFFGGDATWQTVVLGYDMGYLNTTEPGSPTWLGDVGGPKNIGEAYRRNAPVLFYAYDSTFSGYFGYIGETNADQAFAIMNNVFGAYPSGVDGYSPNLTEFPFMSQDFNGMAQGLYLTDLKSVILHLLVEQMGLAEPERYTWTLNQREVISPPGCPTGNQYLVIQRNFGYSDQPLTGPQTGTIYSPYVNNILYTYDILDDCGHHSPNTPFTGIALPFSVDTTIPEYTAVAANDYEAEYTALGGLQVGGFYTGLTEDDVAGLRYLMSSNNIEYEDPAAGSQMQITNAEVPIPIYPLYPLLSYAQTNPPTAVQAFATAQGYPNLVIDPIYSNYYTLVTNWTVASYFTNIVGQPSGSPPVFVVVSNTPVAFYQTNYVYTFDNMVLFQYQTNTTAYVQTISLQATVGGNAGTVTTNVSNQPITLNIPSGQFYILPTNSCGINIIVTNVLNQFIGYYTNFTTTATNSLTPETGFIGTESVVVPLTNSLVQGLPCTLSSTNGPADYRGIEHVQFVRISDNNVDPLTDLFRVPVTNTYTMIMITNFVQYHQTFRRVVTQPDIVLSAFNDTAANTFDGTVTRTAPNFDTGTVQPGLAGPGVINGPIQFDFNKVGTAWWNGPFSDTNSLLFGPNSGAEVNQTTAIPALLWASFDGSTNAITVYPNTASIQELESQMVISVSPTSLPNGTNGIPYGPVNFSATGGSGTYTWSVASNSSLPPGLVLFGNTLAGIPQTNGITSGVSTNGIYDVSIQLMDTSNPTNVVVTPYTITIY